MRLDEDRIADLFIAHWTTQIIRQLKWIESLKPVGTQKYFEVLDEHSTLSIEAIELLDLVLYHGTELLDAIKNTPDRYQSYRRKNNRDTDTKLAKGRVERFIERRWGVSTKRARKILTELSEFINCLNNDTVEGCIL